MILLPPPSKRTATLCPDTTLFRSQRRQGEVEADDRVRNPLSCRRAQDRATDPVAVQVQLGVDDDASGECLGIGSYRHRIGLVGRSEAHTSELQSLMRISYALFCLTKKKTQPI